jgi:hypothetical protein
VLTAGTILVGLVVHWYGTALPLAVRDALGDALWAMMIYWLIGALVPEASSVTRGIVALGVCFVVEASQAYHSEFLDRLRQNRVAHLFLGSDFDVRDLGAYALGVVAAFGLERRFRR